MRLRLRKPQEIIWFLAILLVLISLILFFRLVPGFDAYAYWVVLTAAALLILGTWVF